MMRGKKTRVYATFFQENLQKIGRGHNFRGNSDGLSLAPEAEGRFNG